MKIAYQGVLQKFRFGLRFAQVLHWSENVSEKMAVITLPTKKCIVELKSSKFFLLGSFYTLNNHR